MITMKEHVVVLEVFCKQRQYKTNNFGYYVFYCIFFQFVMIRYSVSEASFNAVYHLYVCLSVVSREL